MATKEELEAQLEIARKDIQTLASMAGGTVREQLHGGMEQAQGKVGELSEEARAVYDSARAEGARLRRVTEDHIRDNPLGTVGIAFVIGMVVAGLLGRK